MRAATPRPHLPRGRFDVLTIALHWTTVALALGLFASGFSFATLEGTSAFASVLWLHRSMGVLVWTLTATRLLWRASLAEFPAFPEKMGFVHRSIVHLGEAGLYALLFLQPATGLAATLLRGQPFPLLAWTIPKLLPRMTKLSLAALTLHGYGAYSLVVVAGGHALAGLVHHYLLRDDILTAMAPWLRPRRRAPKLHVVVSVPAKARDRASG